MRTRYPLPLVALHWATALAVVVAYVSGGEPDEAETTLEFLIGQLHVGAGLAVFALVLLRLPLRALLGAPAAEPGPRWQQRAAHAAHFALYALMLAVPLGGWAALGHEVSSFSLAGFALPLPDGNALWARALGQSHEFLANAFIWLAGLHAVAALVHHYVLGDGVLKRMSLRRAD